MPSAFEPVRIGLCPAGFCVVDPSDILCLRLLGLWSKREGGPSGQAGMVETVQTCVGQHDITLVELGTIRVYEEFAQLLPHSDV